MNDQSSSGRPKKRRESFKTALVRSVIVLGIVVTPFWLASLAWMIYRIILWMEN